MIDIIEQKSISKTGIESSNEDGLFVSDKYIAAIDGATSHNSKLYKGCTGGQVVRNIIMETLTKLSGNETCIEGVRTIQNEIETQFPATRFFHAGASAAILNIKKRCLWMIGDCQAYINGEKYINHKVIDTVLSQVRSLALNAFVMNGHSEDEIAQNDIGRKMIIPFLELQRKFENQPGYFGYPIFNNVGMPDTTLQSKIIHLDIPKNSEVILASDGYPVLRPTLKETENELAKIIATDPFCFKTYFSTKGLQKNNISFDDRTYIRFKF